MAQGRSLRIAARRYRTITVNHFSEGELPWSPNAFAQSAGRSPSISRGMAFRSMPARSPPSIIARLEQRSWCRRGSARRPKCRSNASARRRGRTRAKRACYDGAENDFGSSPVFERGFPAMADQKRGGGVPHEDRLSGLDKHPRPLENGRRAAIQPAKPGDITLPHGRFEGMGGRPDAAHWMILHAPVRAWFGMGIIVQFFPTP